LYTYASIYTSTFLLQSLPPTYTYTLSLHDALPILSVARPCQILRHRDRFVRSHGLDRKTRRHVAEERQFHRASARAGGHHFDRRSEEHTSELQSRGHLVCRLLLEKKKKKI